MEKILSRLTNKKVAGAPTKTTTTTMAIPTLLEAVFINSQTDNNDLSSWEIINPSDDDEIDAYSFDFDEQEQEEDIDVLDSVSSEPDLIIESIDVKVASIDEPIVYDDYDDGSYDCDVMEEEEDEDYDDYDDELVPRSFSHRFGNQRLMKLGKRACNPKMSKPKKLPCYFYNRPGGVHAAKIGVAWKRKVLRA